MRTLVVYDSIFGNTARIAEAIGGALAGNIKVMPVGEAVISEFEALDLLIIGSPTHGGKATPAILELIGNLPSSVLVSLKVAAFDTRLTAKWVTIFGYAASQLAGKLKTAGARLLGPPEAFFVKGKEGPLKEGELERAAAWARNLPNTPQQPG